MDRHATLVAFYAESKPSGLGDYVGGVQRRLVELLGGLFQPRPMPDVHATIIGLESFGRVQPPQELTELRASGSGRPDIAGLCAYLNTTLGQHPPQIQFGGFPNRDLGVTSRGQRLYTRTLTTNANQVILMGWPVDESGQPTEELERIRRDLQKFGVVHRYHKQAHDRDPDLYLVIGRVKQGDLSETGALEAIRLELSQATFTTPLLPDALRVATYDDTDLPLSTTRAWPLTDFLR
ncbi:hypothetical protein [Micromonospora ureilytica]|uniref:Uncharacterized protein n=1 Tax=Micromonospora ureilytica TaxID=709868 RepID=A0ABS0JDS5_9ACTN|nr:hypothetical protein [Micromonospora ureilytica]MBG6065208.1 hypothetical protein [Micromonospora ureilytica]WSR55147.1 hypothetical protein OG400_25690 [Micromonospora ureilytica]